MKTKFNGILTLLLAFVVQISFAQQKTISGTVSEESGPLPGVSILIKGTNTGTETDFNGKYSLKAKVGDILVFRYLGYKTVEKTIGAANAINVTLEESGDTLEEIIVVGYSSQKKADVTGSIVKVNAEQIQNVVTSTVDQALQGIVSGLAVSSNSGTPGSTSQIRIRGISSITAGNEPLYVIDGVPVNNENVSNSSASSFMSSLTGLDSNNIESMTVLKDASATSQYGARGANGVILITTKGGKAGKTKFTFSSSYGVQNDAVNGPDPLSPLQRLELNAEALFNDGRYPSVAAAETALLGGSFAAWDAAGRPNTSWKKIIKNNDAPIQQMSFSASGGGERHTFYASLGYLYQEGTVIGSSFERISGAINFTKDLTDKIKFSSNNSVAYSYQDAFLEQSAYFEGARSAPFFLSPLNAPYNADGSINQFGGSLPNPLYITDHNINDNKFTRIVSNNSISWDIGSGLVAGSRFNVDYQIYNSRTYSDRNYGYGAATSGDASQYMRNNVFFVSQNYLDYNLQLDDNHIFDFKLLQEYQTNKRYYVGGEGENFPDDGLFNLDSAGSPISINSSFLDTHFASYLGLMSYKAFDSKYVLNASFRREASSLFTKDKRWGNFWSVGAAWNINKESFMDDIDFVNLLKLRVSYGTTGNSQISRNQYQSLFAYDTDYNGEGAQAVSTFGNNDLSWEKSGTLDVGVDFGLFNGFMSGSIAYFNRETTDLLLDVPLSLTSGFDSQVQNVGAVSNKGIEVDLKFNLIKKEDFNLSLGGNIGTVNNEVLKLATDPNGIERAISPNSRTRIESGHPINAWYMPTWAGVNPTTGAEEWFINGVDGATTTVYNDAEEVFQGKNGVPTLTAGLNFHFDYKGFFMDANGYYAGGHKVYEGWHRYTNSADGWAFTFQGLSSLMDRWQQPGDVARFGKFTTSRRPWQRHSKYLYDGDFIRLRTLNFGYDFKNKLQDYGIEGLQIYIKGNNLLTWTKDKNLHYDPEVDLGGETGLETPPTKIVSLGLTLKF